MFSKKSETTSEMPLKDRLLKAWYEFKGYPKTNTFKAEVKQACRFDRKKTFYHSGLTSEEIKERDECDKRVLSPSPDN